MGRTFNTFVRTVCRVIPDKPYLALKYRARMGKWIDWDNPGTFSEKLQWIKLHDRKPRYTTMVDKFEAKQYVAEIIGDEYIIPTLGVWNHFDDIDFSILPDQFVLKCTHDSGGLVICYDKKTFDIPNARKRIEKSLRESYYWTGREWPYKGVKPRIIAEKYMSDSSHDRGITDYKTHCFNGVPRVILVCKERFSDMTKDFYFDKWEHLPVSRSNRSYAEKNIHKPAELEEMLKLTKDLSHDIPFLRTDFYTIEGKVFFGELTLFPTSGMERFGPEEFDKQFGEWISLPIRRGGDEYLLTYNNCYILVSTEKDFSSDLNDYKFFCFNGKVHFFKIDFDRFINHRANYYDPFGGLLPFGEADYPPDASREIRLPDHLDEMIELAELLAKDCPFLRVDFYEVNNRVYFGELTLFPASGMGKFAPEDWDKKIGNLLTLC